MAILPRNRQGQFREAGSRPARAGETTAIKYSVKIYVQCLETKQHEFLHRWEKAGSDITLTDRFLDARSRIESQDGSVDGVGMAM